MLYAMYITRTQIRDVITAQGGTSVTKDDKVCPSVKDQTEDHYINGYQNDIGFRRRPSEIVPYSTWWAGQRYMRATPHRTIANITGPPK